MSSARSMEYHVEVSSRAELDLASICTEINAEHSEAAYRWFNGLEAMVFSPVTMPYRGTRTREDRNLGNFSTATSSTSIE